MHSADDVCFCQELVCNTLAGSHCNSKCDVSMSSRRNRGLWANVVDSPLKVSCIQVCDVVVDFCFLWVSFRPNVNANCVERRTLADRAVPVMGDRGCRHHPDTTGLPGLRFLAQHVADRRLRRVFLGRRAESFGFAASGCVVHLAGASRAVVARADQGVCSSGLLYRNAHSRFSQ